MRCLILYAALLSAVSGYKSPSYAGGLIKESTLSPLEMTTLKSDMSSQSSDESTSSSSSQPSSSSTTKTTQSNLIEEVVSELPVSLPPILEEIDLPKRRVITYDQRQEGQYNIRADLDNFMIVLIPPSPAEGLGLLDLLTKSSLRRTSHTTKGKKKHYSSSTSFKPQSQKYRQSLKSSDLNNQNYNYLGLRANEQLNNVGSLGRQEDFIEGRTPYHVDISSLNEEEIQARLNPDRQVDVLPPSYPLAYPHLMKPYHLEAESSLLPPSELGLQNSESSQSQNAGFYRFARYIRGDNFLDTNRVTSSNRLSPQPGLSFRRQQLPFYRSDLTLGASQLYPPLDIPQFNYPQTARNFDLKPSSSSGNSEDIDGKQSLESDLSYGEIIVPPAHLPVEDDLELELHSDSLLEGEAKALLSDGIERCAPAHSTVCTVCDYGIATIVQFCELEKVWEPHHYYVGAG